MKKKLLFTLLILAVFIWTWMSSPMVVTVTGTGEAEGDSWTDLYQEPEQDSGSGKTL